MENIDRVRPVLDDFLKAAKIILADDLVSAVLFGSAAEDKLRNSSDVNLILVLKKFNPSVMLDMQEDYRNALAAVKLSIMFILEEELPDAAESFSVKFSDILSRHKIMYGKNIFGDLEISRHSIIVRTRQVLLNLRMRLREKFVLSGRRSEQLSLLIAESAGPLRSSAKTILELRGKNPVTPKEALIALCREIQGEWSDTLQALSDARESGLTDYSRAQKCIQSIMDLTVAMQKILPSDR